MCDKSGILCDGAEGLNWMQEKMVKRTNLAHETGSLADALKGADIFVGVSAPGIVTEEMVASMNSDAILFAMANPVPEIMPDLAKKQGHALSAPDAAISRTRSTTLSHSPASSAVLWKDMQTDHR